MNNEVERDQVLSHPSMCPAPGEDEILPSQFEPASRDLYRYSEQEINQVARDLFRDGKRTWSENPRLYIIVRDIDQIRETGQPQLIDDLINNGFNDFWIPITSDSILHQILPRELHFQFLQVQVRVCLQPTDFRIGTRSFHGHFSTKDDPPFECRRSVGRGRVGHVEEVLSITDGRLYARKSIRKASYFSDARNNIQRFRCELQALRRIKHRHCVEIVGSYTNTRYLAIIMSPVADSNLKEFLQRAETSLEPRYALRIREWFGCLATAVQYLHTNQIRHRDIKPANILVYRAGVLLVDFELAFDWKDLAQSTTTTYCGRTPLYAAPEVIELKKCNSTSDIWSLGCVFLEMATVLKGKSISQLQQYFTAQTDSPLFFNNPKGIYGWISLLVNLSTIDNAPLLWIPRMLQPDRNLRLRAAAIIDHIRGSHTGTGQPNPYFGECCQRVEKIADLQTPTCLLCGMEILKNSSFFSAPCSKCTNICQSRIYRNPEAHTGILPVQLLISYLHPSFMIQHLTQSSMKEFTLSMVAENWWESQGVDVRLLCLPGQPLYLNVRRFMPSRRLYSLQTHINSKTIAIRHSLPVGIYEAVPEATAEKFNTYLDKIVNSHLIEYASFMLELRGWDHSSRALMVLSKWFQVWREKLPDHELRLIKSAIKLIATQTILGLSLILEEIPEAFKHDYFHGYNGPQPYSLNNQSPRLLNRQVKVAFFILYKSLLEQVLKGFRYLVLVPESWTACLFISMCLAFLLESIEAASQEFLYFAKNFYKDEPGGISDIEDYCREADGVVFDRIYRLLSIMIKGRSSRSSTMDVELSEALRRLRQQFDSEGCQRSQPDIRVQHSSRLVSALLDLVYLI